MKDYKISEIGQKFLAVMEIKKNYIEASDPRVIDILKNIQSLDDDDFADIDKDKLDKNDVENSFYFSVHNPFHHSRIAKEIMGKLFTETDKSKLQRLLEELKEEDAALITSADKEAKETIKKCRKGPFFGGILEEIEVNIVCEIFEKIPSDALNLLGLIKIESEHFPKSYIFLERMLKNLNEKARTYSQAEIKGIFTEALEELEILVGKVKRKKQPTEQPQPKPNEEPNPPKEKEDAPNTPKEDPEKQKGPEDNQKPNENDNPDLTPIKNEAISAIKAALNQTPPLTNSDLSPKFQDWENKINNLTKEEKINFLKGGVLDDIQHQRAEKIKKQTTRDASEIINSNLQNAQRPESTIQDKEEALANNEQYEGQAAYENTEVKEKIKNLKKEVARVKFAEYRNKVISALDTKIKKNRLKEEELDSETQSLIEKIKKQKISDPSQLVETEIKITQSIFKQGATKKIITFKKQVKKALKSNDRVEMDELKKELSEFIKSNNVYYQTKKEEAQQLLKKLESGSYLNSHSSEPLPFSIQIGIGMGAVLIVLSFILIIHRKKRINFIRRRHLHLTKN